LTGEATRVGFRAVEIKLKSAVIRPWSVSDAEAIQRYANNRKIWLNLRDIFPHPYTLENARQFLEMVTHENPQTNFAIATDSEAIGSIRLKLNTDVHRKTAELGYWLAELFWGRGIMSDAVAEFTRRGFQMFDLERIYAEPLANNPASARVLEKAGFMREARLRANVFKDGKLQDSLLYAKLRTDSVETSQSSAGILT
jgi:ribosomal-protein-alanine N-acetyltransferase